MLLRRSCPYRYITRPDISYALFARQIILGNMLHGDRGVYKMFYLPLDRIPARIIRIKDHEDQHCDHYEHIDNNDPGFPHCYFHSPPSSARLYILS